MPEESEDTELDAAAALLVVAMNNAGNVDWRTLQTIQMELARRARGRLLLASYDDVEELVDAVLVRFLQAVRRKRIVPGGAGAYLAKSVQNAAVDAYRTSARRPIAFDEELLMMPIDDDGLARLLAGHAARTDVLRGLSQAASDERFTVVRVVTEWLQQAELTGEPPSSRQVGYALHLSHSTVNAALNEFRSAYLPNPPPSRRD